MKLALIFGTRPEVIKIAPLILESQRRGNIEAITINTAQHADVVDDVLNWFGITPDVTLAPRAASLTTAATTPVGTTPVASTPVTSPTSPTAPAPAPAPAPAISGLNALSAHLFEQLDGVLQRIRPDAVLVQGDTTTVSVAAHAATNLQIPVIHLEAGLRSGNRWSPFPEELNRRTVSALASLHLTPTPGATANLTREGVDGSDISEVGNTVIDALLWTAQRDVSWKGTELETVMDRAGSSTIKKPEPKSAPEVSAAGSPGAPRRIVAITCHRRENWGGKLAGIADAVVELSQQFPAVDFVWPVHPNPAIRATVTPILAGRPNIHVIDPLPYPYFVNLLARATLALSDSGGVQEEAPSLGTPVLVLREDTERPEGIEAGCCALIGTAPQRIVDETSRLLSNQTALQAMLIDTNPYGDGKAAGRALAAIEKYFG
ncbi:MAG: UDP-N-acetylglucosamine 2-epimerase (non-hydrolyzing) [Ancrocorticia sp.]